MHCEGDERGSAELTKPNRAPETLVAQANHFIDPESGAVIPPVQPSSTFARDGDYALRQGYLYSRYASPTMDHAEQIIAELEGGAASMLFGSGLAAIAALIETVPSGKHIVLPRIMYFGAQKWIQRCAAQRQLTLHLVDQTSLEAIASAIRPGETDLVWIETPANPTWDVVDIAAVAELAHEAGAILGVDGTAAPPCTTRAIAFGADISMHSATKYLNGHSDLTAGVLSTRATDRRWEELGMVRCHSGGVLGAFEIWLLIRGMRTLFVRFRQSSETAMKFAHHFDGHPAIDRIIYPGLPTHPGHEIATRQMTGGFGGMMSVLVKGDFEKARRVAAACGVFVPATSLGGVESLIEHRKSVEGPDSPVPDTLLRLSIGLEHEADLIGDFDHALHAA